MMIPMGELLAKAKKEGYGVAAPNVFNRETIEACFLAAKKLRAPIILDVAAVHGIYECADIARYYEKQYPEVPFALNLEHDLYYIENWSLGLDIKILFLTFFKGFVNKNAY